MRTHAIIGAGQVGRRLARSLIGNGESVRLVSRRGTSLDGARVISADAADRESLLAATTGADVIYNCVNPAYHSWQEEWPPIANNLIEAAEHADAVLVTLSNLYGYGPVDHAMTEEMSLPGHTRKGSVRANMWHQALAAHQAGRIRTTEVRASDYIGEAGGQTNFGDRVIPKLRAGKAVTLMGRADQPHSWTYTGDAARLLSIVGTDERAWGKAWHVPSNPPVTQAQVIADLASGMDVEVPRIRTAGAVMMRLVGLFNADARELVEMMYEFDRPFVMDSTKAQQTFGMAPTPWPEVIQETLRQNGVRTAAV